MMLIYGGNVVVKPILLLLTALLLPAAHAFSDTIHVPADYPVIQEAIDAAENGDTVLVAAGTYIENIAFRGKAITVMSASGAADTVIDGAQTDSVVTFNGEEGPNSVLNGFTVTNGQDKKGGGIFCGRFVSATIINNIVLNNTAQRGGGIYCGAECSSLISRNKIIGNTASEYGGGLQIYSSTMRLVDNDITGNHAMEKGGGIRCTFGSTTIEGNRIVDNRSEELGGGICLTASNTELAGNFISGNEAKEIGGGIFFDCDPSSRIAGNFIVGNRSESTGGGIGTDNLSSPVITNSIIAHNIADYYGGGMFCQKSVGTTLVNCTFFENSAVYYGGGICCWNANLLIENSILWGDHAVDAPEIDVGKGSTPSKLNIHHSDVEGGKSGVRINPSSSCIWGDGMIETDPLFVDPADMDWHLTHGSPCRDTGYNAAVVNLKDFEGDPRIAWAGTVDMGADEFYTHLYYTGLASPGNGIKGKLIGLPGTSPVGLFLGTAVLDPPLPTAWGEFHLQPPLQLIVLPAIPGTGVMELPALIPPAPPAPYDIPMQALIGLNPDSLTNLSVMEVR